MAKNPSPAQYTFIYSKSLFGHYEVAISISLKILFLCKSSFKKQPSRGVLMKRCSENMQQIYGKTPMPKCDFNKVAK